MKEFQAILAHLCTRRPRGVLATLVTVEGSSYRRPGARMWMGAQGKRLGAISGGCLEEDLVERARRVRDRAAPELVTYDTGADLDLIWGLGTGCTGVIRVLLEPFTTAPAWAGHLSRNLSRGLATRLRVAWNSNGGSLGTSLAKSDERPRQGVFIERILPPVALTLFGAGDDARPLVRLAHGLGWTVTVADSRPALATRRRFPEASALVVAPAEHLVSRAAPRRDSAVVVMTHRYLHDLPVLKALARRRLGYLGLLGPRSRAERLLRELGRGKAAAEFRKRLRAPVGLDLGAEGADEVALSVVAEVMAVNARRDARPLRERRLPIHG